jgi:ligand-binding SRPBCC domain-containing protein
MLTTEIYSTIGICFDLSRSIDLHKISTAATSEEAIEGRTSGLINLHETVTWQAIHFGIRQKLTTKITAFDRPIYFRDEQIKGIFKSLIHDHKFEEKGNKVIMTDIFTFQAPFGMLGKILSKFILTNYMKQFLIDRNETIKEYAETEKWRGMLNG